LPAINSEHPEVALKQNITSFQTYSTLLYDDELSMSFDAM